MKTTRELQEQYYKCFLPLHAMGVKKIIGYKNRPPLDIWRKNLCKN